MQATIPVFFHEEQLNHKPLFEWAFGDKIRHPESTNRAESILASLRSEKDFFDIRAPVQFPIAAIKEIHNNRLVEAIKSAMTLPADQTFYPSVFPYYRDKSKLDPTNIRHAGAFCFDSGTPLNATTYAAAAWSAACAMDAAKVVESGESRISYALCRPPGHHASRDLFGGYCYFNNAAIAAKRLRRKCSRVAIIDIDFHHGNGTQVLFDRDPSVLVVSIHGDPREFYPFFTGFTSETGSGLGEGFNINYPMPSGVDGQGYCKQLETAINKVIEFAPEALVISAGFDTYVADPIGSFCLETTDFGLVGETFKKKLGHLPTVVVQEGGYEEVSLGRNVSTFLKQLIDKT